MTEGAASRLWARIRHQVDADAGHLHRQFFPQENAAAMTPNDSYVRVWLSELFLAKEVSWGAERSPAVQASVRLLFGGPSPKTFVTLTQPPVTTGRGVFEDFMLTELMPYRGSTVEVQAALYGILGKNHLGTAIDILTGFASLVTPPVSAALAIVDQVATGVETIIEANAQDPVLFLQGALAAPGAGLANELRPGWLAVVRATQDELPASELGIRNGRLCRNGRRLTGFDYMVLFVEGRHERDDWRTPDLDRAINEAAYANALGRVQDYERLRADALSRVFFSDDLTPPQRKQVAQAVKEELDAAAPGAAAEGELTVAGIVERRGLPSRAAVAQLTISELLSGGPAEPVWAGA
ncbi:MAG TPA: hypothetical protein VGM12_30415 [Trebonia sp.]|jgi:hypothetical protein